MSKIRLRYGRRLVPGMGFGGVQIDFGWCCSLLGRPAGVSERGGRVCVSRECHEDEMQIAEGKKAGTGWLHKTRLACQGRDG